MAHIRLPTKTKIKGREVLFIDFKFETYPDEFKNLEEWFSNGFAAQIQNGPFIVYDAKQAITTISTDPHGFEILPDWWIEKASFSKGS